MIYYMFKWNKNTFVDSFSICFDLCCLIVFLFCLHFCLQNHFEMIRCIVKSLIATSTYFLLKYTWKNENLKGVFWVLEFSQMTWIHYWYTWIPYYKYWPSIICISYNVIYIIYNIIYNIYTVQYFKPCPIFRSWHQSRR